MIQDNAQADNQPEKVKSANPTPFKVLTKDTIKVINIESSSGIIRLAALAGNFGIISLKIKLAQRLFIAISSRNYTLEGIRYPPSIEQTWRTTSNMIHC
jgi:hypothetical protein